MFRMTGLTGGNHWTRQAPILTRLSVDIIPGGGDDDVPIVGAKTHHGGPAGHETSCAGSKNESGGPCFAACA